MSYSCGSIRRSISPGADKRSDLIKYLKTEGIWRLDGAVSQLVQWSTNHERYIWFNFSECCQQVRGGDPSPLFCTGEATLGIVSPIPGSSVEERHGYTRESPTSGQEWWRDGRASLVRDLWWFSLERKRLKGSLLFISINTCRKGS